MKRLLARLVASNLNAARTYSSRANRKLAIAEFGDPKAVLKLQNGSVGSPKEDEILIQMLIASINPADINTVQGTYPIKPTLPGVPGHEGVGEVLEVGPNASGVKPGKFEEHYSSQIPSI